MRPRNGTKVLIRKRTWGRHDTPEPGREKSSRNAKIPHSKKKKGVAGKMDRVGPTSMAEGFIRRASDKRRGKR